jgi:hypothetical protein
MGQYYGDCSLELSYFLQGTFYLLEQSI